MAKTSATVLSWIKTEVDHALKVVRDSFATFLATPDDAAVLRVCPTQLHQVSGALRIVGLSGATRFCEALEGAVSGFKDAKPSKASVGLIDRAVLALKEFVDDVARGQGDVPIRLFPVYRELTTLQGRSDISEKELFFPDLTLQPPTHPQPKVLPKGELKPYVQSQRARFQRGLLAWLRNQPAGLQEMRHALDALHQISPQLPDQGASFWAAVGLIDGLLNVPDPQWVADGKALCSKIDFQIRDLAAGAETGKEQLLREILYMLAKCKPMTPRIGEIKQLYELDSLFPEQNLLGVMEFDMDWLQPALNDARSRLEALKSIWVQYISGEPKSVVRFRDLVAAFNTKAGELGNGQLVRLLEVISLVSVRLPDPYPRRDQFMVIEMASAFLLVESVIDSFTNPSPDLEKQIVVMAGWLLDAAKGKSSGEPPTGLRADLTQQIGVLQLRATVAKEIQTNLQHVEQVLDGFSRDPAKRATLEGLKPYLRQIHGALAVLRFQRAVELLAVCDGLISDCAKADHGDSREDMDWIAEGLSSLGFFLDPCLQGREPTEQALTLFFNRFEQRGAQPPLESGAQTQAERAHVVEDVITIITTAAALAAAAEEPATLSGSARAAVMEAEEPAVEPAPAESSSAPQVAIDGELLGIFLDEAEEVLANIDAAVPKGRVQPQDLESLATIRRGFHTLKGSGRMVGLTDLGEVAWEVEQLMNHWLEQRQPATPALLELIASASAAFAGWVSQLRAGKAVAIDGAPIVEIARRLKAGEEPPAAVALEPEEVTIGSTRLTPGFFEIYLKEATQHVAALEAEYDAWQRNTPEEVSHEFLRAAHTLASSSRTATFTVIADLAALLEQWIPFARQTIQPEDAATVRAAIAGLREMVETVGERQPPAPATDVAVSLQELTARLQASPPPPVETTTPKLVAFAPPPAPQPPAPAPIAVAPPAPSPRAEPAPAAPQGRELRVMRDDIDEQLLPIFLEEAQVLLPQIGSDLRDWKASPGDEKVWQSLQRGLHTLKGSARMAGAIRLGELTHIMESRVDAAIESNQVTPELFEDLESKMDRLTVDLERMQAGGAAPATPVEPVAAAPSEAPREPAARAEAPLHGPAAMLRVNADIVDHLINDAGEVSIARSRIEAELRAVKQSLGDLNDSISRLRAQLREVEIQADSQMQSRLSVLEERKGEFDPLEFDRYTRLQELTRMMAESLHDATSIQQGLLKNLGDTDAALVQQARISRDVQQELMRMRAVPFSNLNERLYRIVRQVGRELDKKAELEIEGSQVELDRSVLERVGAPLEHMLRNALVHGLESPAARAHAGKPETGRITLTLRQESNEIALILSDDGAGLDLEALHRKAIERGLLERDQAVTESELAQLVFASGLSTSQSVTELAGRGVGMDVVRNEISAIGGRVDIDTARGKGTTFTVYLPLTLAVTQAVLVRGGTTVLAISTAMVEQVLRLNAEAMAGLYEKNVVEFQGRSYPLHYLKQVLGSSGATEIQNYNSVLLLRSGIQRIALHVDELTGNQEIVVKNIGPQLARVPGVSGATVLADGRIVPIINPVSLAHRARIAPARAAAPAPDIAKPALPVVMVVDDSLTVRKITSRLLEREGYRVLTAKDGVEALEQLKDTLPVVMLVDIEMPRMDGFELTKNVRSDPRTHGVPIIIISSRTAEKHRSQAEQLGVNSFLGKPYPEAELLARIATFVAVGSPLTLH